MRDVRYIKGEHDFSISKLSSETLAVANPLIMTDKESLTKKYHWYLAGQSLGTLYASYMGVEDGIFIRACRSKFQKISVELCCESITRDIIKDLGLVFPEYAAAIRKEYARGGDLNEFLSFMCK